jgi:hypothetical protein
MRRTLIFTVLLLSGCTTSADWQKLLEDVKQNCHTQIDAQIGTTISGIGGSGHFQQECWPEGTAPMHTTPAQ